MAADLGDWRPELIFRACRNGALTSFPHTIVSVAIAGAIVGSAIIPSLAYAVAYLAYFSQVVIHPVLQALLIREIKDVMAKCRIPGK